MNVLGTTVWELGVVPEEYVASLQCYADNPATREVVINTILQLLNASGKIGKFPYKGLFQGGKGPPCKFFAPPPPGNFVYPLNFRH